VCLRQQDDERSAAHRSSTLPSCVLDSKTMSRQQHTPAALYPLKYPVPILQEDGWALLSLWTWGKSRPHQSSFSWPSSPQPVAILAELLGPHLMVMGCVKLN